MKILEFLIQLGEELLANQTVCLMVVSEHSKGSPGKRGFKMALSSRGHRFGTIGGGIMEHQLLQRASDHLKKGGCLIEEILLYHNRKAPPDLQSGLICAGYQKVLLTTAIPAMAPQILHLAEQIKALEPACWHINAQGLHLGVADIQNSPLWEEDLSPEPVVYVFGSGHVGRALCRVLQTLDFPVISVDHRAEPLPGAQESFAHKTIWGQCSPIGDHIKWGKRRFACVVSPSKDQDVAFLREILPHPWEFVGVMGSHSKIQAIQTDLGNSGCLQTHIAKIAHPIGLDIASQTPEEIAVSIAAQLIRMRRNPGQELPT